MTKEFILASTSPRRQELLKLIGINFRIEPSNIPENIDVSLAPNEIAKDLAKKKATHIANCNREAMVLAADTIVCLNSKILGKPRSTEEAQNMLRSLSGRTHQVITGVALICLRSRIEEVIGVSTDVTFGEITDQLINKYIETGEPMDKAGAYGIQGMGAILVKAINGSYYNVVGLPLFEVASILRKYELI